MTVQYFTSPRRRWLNRSKSKVPSRPTSETGTEPGQPCTAERRIAFSGDRIGLPIRDESGRPDSNRQTSSERERTSRPWSSRAPCLSKSWKTSSKIASPSWSSCRWRRRTTSAWRNPSCRWRLSPDPAHSRMDWLLRRFFRGRSVEMGRPLTIRSNVRPVGFHRFVLRSILECCSGQVFEAERSKRELKIR